MRIAREMLSRLQRLGMARSIALPGATVIALLVLWEVAVRAFEIPIWLLPPPSSVLRVIVEYAGTWPEHIWATFQEIVGGFILAIVVAIPLAAMIVYSPILRDTIYPLLVIFQTIPKVAIAPLLLIWLGYGMFSTLTVAFLIAFFPIVVATVTGMNTVSPDLLDLARVLSANEWQIFRKIRFPGTLPEFFGGLRVAATLAVVGAVIGEFVGASVGLGFQIMNATAVMNTSLAFASMLILSIMGLSLFLIVDVVERIVCPWARHAKSV